MYGETPIQETNVDPTSDADELGRPQPRWELHRLAVSAWSTFKWMLRGLLVVGALLTVAEILVVYHALAGVHPWLGLMGAGVFVVLLVWLVGRPLLGLVRIPRSVSPPRMPAAPGRTVADGWRQLAYLDRYLKNLEKNPALLPSKETVESARRRLASLRDEVKELEDPRRLSAHINHYEREVLLPLLEPLDRKAETLIHREALAIGSMTALSPNGTLDAFLVLWRNINLVASLARLYYGRPGVWGTWLILRDVSSAILLSSVLEQISDMGGSLLRKVGEGGRTIPLLGALVGPVLDGAINGLMTMKVGYLAQERCRSFRAWDGRTKRGILRRTFHLVSDSAGLLLEELTRSVSVSYDLVRATAGASKEAMRTASSKTLGLFRILRRVILPGAF